MSTRSLHSSEFHVGKTVVNYLYYIKKRLKGQKGFLLNICVSSLALALLCMVVTMPQILLHGKNTVKQTLGKDLSKYGVVRNSGGTTDNEAVSDYIFEIYDAPEIESVGTWDYLGWSSLKTVGGGKDYWKEILKIQNRYSRKSDKDPEVVEGVYMLSQAFHFNNLELYSGDVEQIGTNQGYLLYLGYNFREIPIGAVFVQEISENTKYTYVVAGILEKGASVIDGHLLWNLRGFQLSCYDQMDNNILLIPPCSENYYSTDYFFKCSDGYTYEEASRRIQNISEKYGIQADTGTLEYRIDTVLSETDWLLNVFSRMSVLLFLSAFIMLLTTQLLTILFRKDELGVWLISGIGRREIFRILLGENIIKMLISSCLSFGIMIFIKNMIISSREAAYELRYILWVNIPVFFVLCALLTALLCSAIAMAYIRNKSIPEIVRGTWD